MKLAIQAALRPLVGQPLWAAGRAASIAWFQFGGRHTVSDGRSGTKEVGSYAIHLDCPWTWTRPWGDVVADHNSGDDELTELALLPVAVRNIAAEDDASVRITFDDSSVLTVQPEPDADTEEYWRFFEPFRETPHFVVGPGGVEREA